MKKLYSAPEAEIMKYSIRDILTASDEEVFVDGGGLFGDSKSEVLNDDDVDYFVF